MFHCVVFDFDGTLVDSNAVKQRAYYDIFRPEDRVHIAAVLHEQRYANRFVKVELILRRITGGAPARKEVERYAAAYNDICELHQTTCAPRPGAEEALARLAGRTALYLCSGTFEVSLRRIIERRGWGRYFCEVFGSPQSKAEILGRVASHAGLPSASILVVGDTRDDLDAAAACGCAFAGIRSDATDFDENAVRMIGALAELEAMC